MPSILHLDICNMPSSLFMGFRAMMQNLPFLSCLRSLSVRAAPFICRRRQYAVTVGSRESRCDRAPPDLSLDRLPRLVPGQQQFIVLLNIHPEIGARAEVPCQTQCCIGGNPATLVDDLADAVDRYVQFQSEAVERNSQRLHELLAEHFAWVNRRTGDIPAAFRTHDAHIFAPSI